MADQSENLSLPTVIETFDIEKNVPVVLEEQTKLTRFVNFSSVIGGVSVCALLGMALITSQPAASKPSSFLSGTLLDSNLLHSKISQL